MIPAEARTVWLIVILCGLSTGLITAVMAPAFGNPPVDFFFRGFASGCIVAAPVVLALRGIMK